MQIWRSLALALCAAGTCAATDWPQFRGTNASGVSDATKLPVEFGPEKNVVWKDSFWLPDEAASVYSKARAVVSMECHSPLIALRNGTPAFYIREPTDTCKGQMYRDIGADEWFFEIDETSGEQLWSRLASIERDPAAAKGKVKSIMVFVESRQKRMVSAVHEACRV